MNSNYILLFLKHAANNSVSLGKVPVIGAYPLGLPSSS